MGPYLIFSVDLKISKNPFNLDKSPRVLCSGTRQGERTDDKQCFVSISNFQMNYTVHLSVKFLVHLATA